MRINNNMMAMNTHRQLGLGNAAGAKSMEKLSSGFRINRAGDDAAGLSISEKMRGQIRGLTQASRNAQDSISLIQTAEGALNETQAILQRMRELAVQSSNDTNTSIDRDAIKGEIEQLVDEIDRIANTTEFNTQKLLDGTKKGLVSAENSTATLANNSSVNFAITTATDIGAANSATINITATNESTAFDAGNFNVSVVGGTGTATIADGAITYDTKTITLTSGFLKAMKAGESITISVKGLVAQNNDVEDALSMQIGANSGQNMLIGINSMKAADLGVRDASGNAVDVSTAGKATAAITQINNAIESVSEERSKLGAYQNRLEHTIKNLDTSSENLQASESRIRDVDMAKEMMEFTKNNILQQAAQAMLAQANQAPQGVLQLLR
ncbi:MAG: flagellin [Peptostreptococcaceae bacterium]|jgi:flagellin|nr:flagellin [Peptostreptococcaceae bacterium]